MQCPRCEKKLTWNNKGWGYECKQHGIFDEGTEQKEVGDWENDMDLEYEKHWEYHHA